MSEVALPPQREGAGRTVSTLALLRLRPRPPVLLPVGTVTTSELSYKRAQSLSPRKTPRATGYRAYMDEIALPVMSPPPKGQFPRGGEA